MYRISIRTQQPCDDNDIRCRDIINPRSTHQIFLFFYLHLLKHMHSVNPITREVNEAKRPHTCSRPCAFQEKTKQKETPQIPGLWKSASYSSRNQYIPRMLHINTQTGKRADGQIGRQAGRPTDYLNNVTVYAPRYEEVLSPYKKKMDSFASFPRPCLITSKEVIRQGGLTLEAGRVRSNKNPPTHYETPAQPNTT